MDGTVGNHIFPVFSASYPSCPFRLHEVDRRGHGCILPSHVGNGEGKALAGKLTAAFVKSVRRRALAQGIAPTVLTPEHGGFNDDLAALGPSALAARLAPRVPAMPQPRQPAKGCSRTR